MRASYFEKNVVEVAVEKRQCVFPT